MDYYPKTLSNDLGRTRGDLLASLLSIRPVVEAVALLHDSKLVHRDIKPDNVFVASDGRLVLGDFGLAIRMDDNPGRLTDTYENVGSRDWMPGWAMGMRIEDVKPTFDVFSLEKLLWAMISGKAKLRLWYLHDHEFELEQMFPDDKSIRFARTILDKCIVEREKDCLKLAGELLSVIDVHISLLRQHGQTPRNGPMQCRICAFGHYSVGIREDTELRALACDYCGNIQWFSRPDQRPGWQ
jgi:serine/threonine protein kinase